MKALRHAFGQPFITATGAAALVHSTWALGTLFSGLQPDPATQLMSYLGWLVPALLISFALDVGQIATSAEIREHGLTRSRGITFFVFSAATYYLQWLYIAHHMPSLALAAGVRETWAGFATVMRDSAVWIVPALLPLSTLLYTLSGKQEQVVTPVAAPITNVSPVAPPAPAGLLTLQEKAALPEPSDNPEQAEEIGLIEGEIIEMDGMWIAKYGTWQKSYTTRASALRALAGYKGRYRQMGGHYAQR
jgi:hypothetical protein